jgi:hypothetical protein
VGQLFSEAIGPADWAIFVAILPASSRASKLAAEGMAGLSIGLRPTIAAAPKYSQICLFEGGQLLRVSGDCEVPMLVRCAGLALIIDGLCRLLTQLRHSPKSCAAPHSALQRCANEGKADIAQTHAKADILQHDRDVRFVPKADIQHIG